MMAQAPTAPKKQGGSRRQGDAVAVALRESLIHHPLSKVGPDDDDDDDDTRVSALRELLWLLMSNPAGGAPGSRGTPGIVAKKLAEANPSASVSANARACEDEDPPLLQIFICPGDGGVGADGYRPFAKALATNAACRLQVYVFEGFLTLERASLEDLARGCVDAMVSCGGDPDRARRRRRSCCLVAHSWGSLVALEMARRLEEAGQELGGSLVLLDPSADLFLANDVINGHGPEETLALQELLLALLERFRVHKEHQPRLAELALEGLSTESVVSLKAVAATRLDNLSLRPMWWPHLQRPLQTECVLLLAVSPLSSSIGEVAKEDLSECTEWYQVSKRRALHKGLGDIVNISATIWVDGDHYSMLESPHVDRLAEKFLLSVQVDRPRGPTDPTDSSEPLPGSTEWMPLFAASTWPVSHYKDSPGPS